MGLLRTDVDQQLSDLYGQAARIDRSHQPGAAQLKNYVLFLGATEAPTNQAPCLSLIQHQIEEGELVISAYQRSSDASLGLPSDLYHLYLMSRQIELPLRSITLNLGNVHIYDTNIEATRRMLDGEEGVKYTLNV